VFCGLNVLFIMPVIFKQLVNLLSMSAFFFIRCHISYVVKET
jgi:hypothetical protein